MLAGTLPYDRLLRAVAWRAAALGPCAVAVGANIAYAALRRGNPAGATTLAELCLSLLAFTAAGLGVLLLLHGRRLFGGERAVARRPPLRATIADIPSIAVADRHAMAHLLTMQALARARAAHRQSHHAD